MAKRHRGQADDQELERQEQIKKLVVIAMFSDDKLMECLVLKGGNLIDLIFQAGSRASVDIDLSMERDFDSAELDDIRIRIENSLQMTFRAEDYEVFGVILEEKPETLSPELKHFWGGYVVTFKLIEAGKYAEFSNDPENLSRNAVRIGPRGKFEIDISKFEYCTGKTAHYLDSYRIFTYTPEMVVWEKLRAICQQMPEYGPIVDRNRPGTARARDFFDIYTLVEHFRLNMMTAENRVLLKHIFAAKKVPLSFLDALPGYREFHRADFQAVQATIKPGVILKDFDFYFDAVVSLCTRLKTPGDV
ncbi:MAG TPA: nucleotidyl transferase AbiEii/AbiGii toxin family protein [Phycisphaerae bacterium]|nr:nucleotidyl transferase AbiEii/AbiGii toxin family protein [Phycisphaerae bacterium]